MDLSKYRAARPYPEIIELTPDPADVRCLRNDYAGPVSETTAILTYIYQSYILKPARPEMAKDIEGIAITEMHHHELLGSAISKMHGDPILAGHGGFWTARSVNFTKNPKEFLKENIKSEESAIAEYLKTINCLKCTELKELISRIIEDEEIHIKLFYEMLKQF